jgi:hypothetical protein
MGIHISYGSGRAKCRLCNTLIGTKEIDVRFSGYQMERHFHKKCIDNEVSNYKKRVK